MQRRRLCSCRCPTTVNSQNTDRQADRQAGRQTDRQIDRQATHTHTCGYATSRTPEETAAYLGVIAAKRRRPQAPRSPVLVLERGHTHGQRPLVSRGLILLLASSVAPHSPAAHLALSLCCSRFCALSFGALSFSSFLFLVSVSLSLCLSLSLFPRLSPFPVVAKPPQREKALNVTRHSAG